MKKNIAGSPPAPPRLRAAPLAARLAAREAAHDRQATFASDNIETLAEEGFFTLNVPTRHGGLGADLEETIESLRELAHGSPSTALMLAMHTSILANYLLDPELVPAGERVSFLDQREWAFGEASKGKIFGVANSEPGAGGDVHHSQARVTGGARIEGLKSFCSMGLAADYFMAAARDEEGVVDYYLVSNEADHVTVGSPWDAIGMRSSESVTLRFDQAKVIGPLGYRGMLDGANNRHWSTLSFTAIFIGVAESLVGEIVPASKGMLQRVTAVELELTLQAARAYLRHCIDREPPRPDRDYLRLVRDCKLFVTRALAREAAAIYSAQSGSAYRFSSAVSRKFRDLLAGPMLRPPVGVWFDAVWEELEENAKCTMQNAK